MHVTMQSSKVPQGPPDSTAVIAGSVVGPFTVILTVIIVIIAIVIGCHKKIVEAKTKVCVWCMCVWRCVCGCAHTYVYYCQCTYMPLQCNLDQSTLLTFSY